MTGSFEFDFEFNLIFQLKVVALWDVDCRSHHCMNSELLKPKFVNVCSISSPSLSQVSVHA